MSLPGLLQSVWTWIDGELFLPESWFTPAMAEARRRTGVPADRQFATKIELGWRMIQRVQAQGLSFEAVACDDLYGRSGWLQREMDEAHLLYMADVPENLWVYLTKPASGPGPARAVLRGRQPRDPRLCGKPNR